MAERRILIDQIYPGIAPSQIFSQKGQYLGATGIDPDMPLSDSSSDVKPGGAIRPVKYAEFSGSNVTSWPVAIITNPKDAKVYAILRNGRLISYSSALGSETLIGTVTGSQASGALYYNNYIYIFGTGASHDDVARYGPLNGTPTLTNGVWKGSTLGTQTALTDTTYPATRHSVQYLNHHGFVHVDNKAYFFDYINGIGYVHFIKTTKTTDEGDTDNGSTYGALDLPFGFLPLCGSSYGNNVAIGASQTTDGTLNQGSSKIFLWDTTADSFYRAIPVPDPIISSLRYENGVLYIISGTIGGGVRLSRYVGGDSIQTLDYIPEGHPPLQNAHVSLGMKQVWGSFGTYPANYAGLMSYGTQSDLFPRGFHNIAVSSLTPTSSNGLITAVANAIQNTQFPQFLMGGTDGTNYNLDSKSTTYGTHVLRSQRFNVGRPFTVKSVRLPLAAAVAANMTLTPKLYFDNAINSQAGTTVNSTTYPNSEHVIMMSGDNFSNNVHGENDVFLELTLSGTALMVVLLPIEIIIDVEGTE